MNKKDIEELYDYNRWANGVTLRTVSALTSEQLTKDLATSYRSVHGTLTHIFAAEWIWLMRCNGTSPNALFDPADYPTLDSLKLKWIEIERGQEILIYNLTDQALTRVIAYTNTKGEEWRYPLGQILQHVVNHSTYHRGQVTTLLRQLDAQPETTDLLAFVDLKPPS